MKAISFILGVFILGNIQATGNELFQNGTELQVIAPSGLKLRLAPGSDSKSIATIEYGEAVHILTNETEQNPGDRYEWADGNWVKVEHNGLEGYVFDGFLTDLPLPFFEGEFSMEDMDLISPLENWFENHFELSESPDTLLRADRSAKVICKTKEGHRLIKNSFEHYYRLDVFLSNKRIMDGYLILQSMLYDKTDKEVFRQASTFVEGNGGEVKLIKVGTDNQIKLKKLENDQIQISLYSPHTGCTI